ncbi:hypothetical protein EV122DRAFT_226689 [Schizophyllum commune]
MAATEDEFRVPSMLLRTVAGVCRHWHAAVGTVGSLWTHIAPRIDDGLPSQAVQERIARQFAAHISFSRNQPLHLRMRHDHVPLLRCHLRELSHRWASMQIGGYCYDQVAVPLSLRSNALLEDNNTSHIHIMDAAPNLKCLTIRIIGHHYYRYRARMSYLRAFVPLSASVTSLELTFVGSLWLGNFELEAIISQCAGTLEELRVDIDGQYQMMAPLALPLLRIVHLHRGACSLIRALILPSIQAIWLEYAVRYMHTHAIHGLQDSLKEGLISGLSLRHLHLSNIILVARQDLEDIVKYTANIKMLTLVDICNDCLVPFSDLFLRILSDTDHNILLPGLQRLNLLRGVQAGSLSTRTALHNFLIAPYRRQSLVQVVTDVAINAPTVPLFKLIDYKSWDDTVLDQIALADALL